MSVNYVLRTPARAITAAIALASGVAALTALSGIAVAFQGEVVGTLLGDAVSIQVRGADLVAALVVTLIGLGSLLDILYLDLREQAARYASLQAAGWRDGTLTRLITGQAFLIGGLGAVAGAGLGLAAVAMLTPLTAPPPPSSLRACSPRVSSRSCRPGGCASCPPPSCSPRSDTP